MNQLSYWVHHMVVTTVCAKHQIGSASIFFTRLSQGLLSSNWILAAAMEHANGFPDLGNVGPGLMHVAAVIPVTIIM